MEKAGLKVVFSEVLRGYSLVDSPLFGKVRVKHFNNFDSAELDIKNKAFFDKAVEKGLTTRKDRIDYLLKENIWTQEENKEILNTKSAIAGLQKTKTKIFLQSHIDQANRGARKAGAQTLRTQL